jgi:peptidoglycan/xylan/chitin deacetylase (PgdA/CDA1 family)
LVRSLALHHEVGSHTDDHRVLDGVALAEQRARLSRSRDALEAITGARATTFRAPEERTDANTIVALAEAGFECVVASNGRAAMPEIIAVPLPRRAMPATIVRIPRVVSDDYDWFVHSAIAADSIAPRLRQALARTRRIGGVLVVSLHTQFAGTPEHIGAVTPFLDDLAQQPLWITTAGQVARWWKHRDACRVSLASRRGRFALTVENRNDVMVDGLVARVELPSTPPALNVRARSIAHAAVADIGGAASAAGEHTLRPHHNGTFVIPLPRLGPREKRVFDLDPILP